MFDVSFSELAIIGTVALLVLGPEKLPKVAKSAGEWLGKAQRYVHDVKSQINREIAFSDLKKAQDSLQTSMQDFQTTVNRELSSLENEIVPPLQVDIPDDPYGSARQRDWRPRVKKLRHKRVSVPHWYKQVQVQRTRLLSGAARMQRHKKF